MKNDARGQAPARMPAVFAGHGSPMNAVEDNAFSRGWTELGAGLPRPKAVLCVSAHWLTKGSAATAMERPRTIHDFGGFPEELYRIEYPAPGSPGLAREAADLVGAEGFSLDMAWGLDHGAWSVLRRMFPAADVPVVQLGIDPRLPASAHVAIARRLAPLRDRGVLVVASGNVVHNLGRVAWDRMDGKPFGFDWALEFDAKVKRLVVEGRVDELADYGKLGASARLAVPTNDHYIPLLYAAALRGPDDDVTVFNEAAVGGSLTMTSYVVGHS